MCVNVAAAAGWSPWRIPECNCCVYRYTKATIESRKLKCLYDPFQTLYETVVNYYTPWRHSQISSKIDILSSASFLSLFFFFTTIFRTISVKSRQNNIQFLLLSFDMKKKNCNKIYRCVNLSEKYLIYTWLIFLKLNEQSIIFILALIYFFFDFLFAIFYN